MAYATNQAAPARELEKAAAWINIYVQDSNGKALKLGAIPLKDSVALQARVIQACRAKGIEAIEGHVVLDFQEGGGKAPGDLALPF